MTDQPENKKLGRGYDVLVLFTVKINKVSREVQMTDEALYLTWDLNSD